MAARRSAFTIGRAWCFRNTGKRAIIAPERLFGLGEPGLLSGVGMAKFRTTLLISIGLILTAGAIFLRFAPVMIDKSQNKVVTHESYLVSPQATALHETLIIGDLHADALLWKRNLSRGSDHGHVDFPKLRAGNIAIQVFPTVTKSPAGQNYVENSGDTDMITLLAKIQLWPHRTWHSLSERALCQAQRLHRYEVRHPEQVKIIRTSDDLHGVLEARAGGTPILAALLSIEGAHALEGDIHNIKRFHKEGFRLMELHHFFDNAVGGSLHGQSKAGLTPLGRDMVREMEAQDIIIDVAHSSEAVVTEVLDIVTRPIIVSHTGFRGQCDSPRNISDNLLRKIGEHGGLIGIGFWDGAICDISPNGIVAAIRYAINEVGVDHVALGSDWDGTTTVSIDASEVSVLTDRMLAAGFTREEIRKVMGGNLAGFLLKELPGGTGRLVNAQPTEPAG